MSSLQPAVPLSVRISSKSRDQLEELASATGRSKSFLAGEAIEQYLAMQIWQVQSIRKAVKKAESKAVKFISHEQVIDWLNKWGSDEEKEPPA